MSLLNNSGIYLNNLSYPISNLTQAAALIRIMNDQDVTSTEKAFHLLNYIEEHNNTTRIPDLSSRTSLVNSLLVCCLFHSLVYALDYFCF